MSRATFCILPIAHAGPHLHAKQTSAVGWKCGVSQYPHVHRCSICEEPFDCILTPCLMVDKYAVCEYGNCIEAWNMESDEDSEPYWAGGVDCE